MLNKKFQSLVFFSALLATSSSLNILGIFPHPGSSHFRVYEPLLRALAEKGHTLTVISPFPQKEPLPRYKDISLENETNIILNSLDMKVTEQLGSILWASMILKEVTKELCLKLRSKPIQEFLKSEENFDLIITEINNSDCYLGFVHKYKIPFIGICSNTIMPWNNNMLGNPGSPAYIPINFLSYSDRMTFMQRVHNAISYVIAELIYKFIIEVPSFEEAKLHFGDDLPRLNQIASNISLMLINSHFSLNLPRPFVPNIIEVGGIFIEKQKKIPQNIEKFIAESKHGVFYFSMGSMIKGNTFPEEKLKIFLSVLSKLKQRVLWKWESDSMPNQPPNVMIQKWMPQRDILCHPNVIAFISHGGLLSTSESVYCGKPAVIMPQYADQFLNGKALQVKNAGVVLSLAEATEKDIYDALNKVVEPSFKKNAERLSVVFRDRPLSAMDTAIYWVEYVGRHKDTSHLRSAAVDMPLYQYILLDVLLFIIISFFVILFVNFYFIKFIFRMLKKNDIVKFSKATIEKVKKN